MNGEARHGTVVDRRQTGGGANGTSGAYTVQDDEDQRYYGFDYRQIVTEGFRTIRIGESVRFHVSAEIPGRAEFVIRLDQPDPSEYYA
ncbi:MULTISPECIES: hypothetical protein [unclassified Streptomyces]|uniref:Uncharacterized protein n=1 Tax=Streptomyces flavovirens TaxID=52258 RepID=A0ABV8N1K0_9ACTN|nr:MULTISPECIES: hypothetical protein [unclassified Streptomyces]MYR66108.1 hypothetical protein [Streptomyces sp. SID4939]MYT84199.1 hypothetical protein [Streptomyces sp. SID8360]AEN12897.1 conserved hypothetical protein [Streptomyces sp. SirexAA-E]MBK3593073.1 hypothetical protein [Streptomyces sp. MBT51]MYS00957.1 hypothetical protein [Streptomyces sp. SID4940]